jgi:hypothetical protein
MTFMVYVDNGILIDPDKGKIDSALLDLQSKFVLQDEGNLSNYLGVKVQKHSDGAMDYSASTNRFNSGRSEIAG